MAAFTLAWAAITIFVLKVISGPPKPNMAAVPRFVYIKVGTCGPTYGGCRMDDAVETRKHRNNPKHRT